MRVFVTGATGWIGSQIVRLLLASGHEVTGLVRSEAKGADLAAAGATPLVGGIGDLDTIRRGAADADGVIHTPFGTDFSKIVEMAEEERRALEAFGEIVAGSNRPVIVTSGLGLAAPGHVLTESERPAVIPAFPRASEQTAFALAERGINAMVVRNPRSVHGQGERHGFIPMLAAVARQKGVSAWIGEGLNLWPSAHRLDAARVYTLALERGEAGAAYHAVAEEGVAYRAIAEAIGRQLGLPARAISPEEGPAHFGPLATWVAGNGPASSAATRRTLGWSPQETGLIADIERPDYSTEPTGLAGR